jgi:N-acyl-D-aspartate/D-glutamate deacylase
VLAPGAAADIVVFDSANFRETGTLQDPNHLAQGVHQVLVNGVPAIENGSFTTHRSGQVLRRA